MSERRILFAALAVLVSLSLGTAHAFGNVRYGTPRESFATGIYEPRLLAELPNGDAEPFLVMSGLGCKECDINRSIYIHSPAQGSMAPGERAPRFTHPGEYRDTMTERLVETARMFVGHCTADGKAGVLWLHRFGTEAGGWREATFMVQVEDGRLVESKDLAVDAARQAANAAIASKACREIRGLKFSTEP